MVLSVEQCSAAAQILATVLVAIVFSEQIGKIRNERLQERFSWWRYDAHSKSVHLLFGLSSLSVLTGGVFLGGLTVFWTALAAFGTFATLVVFVSQVVKDLLRGSEKRFDQPEDDS